jgi:mannose-1-phosphate guanylyltransferase
VVIANKRPLAVVGMSNAAVIDSGDAVLVLPKDKSQDVRKVVEELKARKLNKFL